MAPPARSPGSSAPPPPEPARDLRPRVGSAHEDLPGAPLDEIRFRLPRHSADALKHLRLSCTFADPDGRMVRVPILDFSESGLGIPAVESMVLRAGEVLRGVEVTADERVVFRGAATVVHQGARPDRLGLKLIGPVLEINQLLEADERAGALAAISHRLRDLELELRPETIPGAYRAVIADLAACLTELHMSLGRERRLEEQGLDEEALDIIEEAVTPVWLNLVGALNAAMEGVPLEQHPPASSYAKRLLHPLLLGGPIPWRAYEKPLGYAGDYLLMNQIYKERDSGPGPFARLINRLSCSLPITVAGVARIRLLTDLLEREIAARAGRRVRIASLGCGPAEEIQELMLRPLPAETGLHLALIDQDRDALSFVNRRFLRLETEGRKPAGVDVAYFNTAVRTVVNQPEKVEAVLGRFDVVYSVGLFDYLPDPAARTLTANLARFLEPGGVLLIGNFSHHGAEVFMEHILDWRLIYRDEAALRRLAERAIREHGGTFAVDVVAEQNGIHLFLVLRRPA